MTKQGKQIVYLTMSFVTIALSVWFQMVLRFADYPSAGFRLTMIGGFLLGLVITGSAIGVRTAKIEAIQKAKSELLFCTFAGIGILAITLICFFLYGGLTDFENTAGNHAVNFAYILCMLYPLPFLGKAAGAHFATPDTDRAESKFLSVLFWVLLALYIALIVVWGIVSFQRGAV